MFITSAISQTFPDSTNSMLKIDTTKIFVSLIELRNISDYLKEVEYRRAKDALNQSQIQTYQSLVIDFNDKEKLYLQKIENLEKEVKLISPPFWDRFYIGAIVGTAATMGTILGVIALTH